MPVSRMLHRKWRETEQQLGWWPDLALLSCCLVYFQFLRDIQDTSPVYPLLFSYVPLSFPSYPSCSIFPFSGTVLCPLGSWTGNGKGGGEWWKRMGKSVPPSSPYSSSLSVSVSSAKSMTSYMAKNKCLYVVWNYYYCSCLTILPGPARVLLSNVLQTFISGSVQEQDS